MKNINEMLGKNKVNICEYCKAKMNPEELNHEAMIHHKAKRLECINRKSCEKRKRKLKK